MNIQDYRSSFTVYVLDGDLNRGTALTEEIDQCGYNAHLLLGFQSLSEQVEESPPHIVIMNYSDDVFCLHHDVARDNIHWLMAKLPEVHIILLAKDEDLEAASEFYEEGIYDLVETPVFPSQQLLRSVDRAATTDYYLYMNEQLRQESQGSEQQDRQQSFELFEIWNDKLQKVSEEGELIQMGLEEMRRRWPESQVVFLRYVPKHKTLVAEQSAGYDPRLLNDIGVDLSQTEPQFKQGQLLRPDALVGLNDLVRNGFQQRHFAAFPIKCLEDIFGIFLILLGDRDSRETRSDAYCRTLVKTVSARLSQFALEQKLQRLTVLDEVTETLNRKFFLKKLKEEISRARRISRPVSLLILQVDQFNDLSIQYDRLVAEQFMKSLVEIFMKNSRVTDLLGRLDAEQFGLILPHTDRKGAAIKAERLRRIIESADFSEVLPGGDSVSISIGASEYPSVCHDASDLLKTADEALLEVIKFSKNRVCIASALPNFVPDFEVRNP